MIVLIYNSYKYCMTYTKAKQLICLEIKNRSRKV